MASTRSQDLPLALVISVALALLVSIGGGYAALCIRSLSSWQQLADLLTEPRIDTARARRLIDICLGRPILRPQLFIMATESLLQAATDEQAGQADKALEPAVATARQLEASGELNPDQIAAVILLRKTSAKYQAALDESRASTTLVKDATARIDRLEKQLELMAEDMTSLFSLSPALPATEGETVVLYQSGVLTGLPALNGIPDGIETLEGLSQALKLAEASLPVLSSEEFALRLRGIREATAGVVNELKNARTDFDHAMAGENAASQKLLEELVSWRNASRNVVLLLSTPFFDWPDF